MCVAWAGCNDRPLGLSIPGGDPGVPLDLAAAADLAGPPDLAFPPDLPGPGIAPDLGLSSIDAADEGTDLATPDSAVTTIAAMPAQLDFGVVDTGTVSDAQPCTITNDGPSDLSAISISATGDTQDFAIDAGTCSGPLAPTASCTFSVRFAPVTFGNKEVTLVVGDPAVATTHITATGVGRDRVSLTVTLMNIAPGTGRVTGTDIDCPTTCTATEYRSSTVTLNAVPDPGSIFGGWTGSCDGFSPTCSVALSDSKTVGARFFRAANLAFLTSMKYSIAEFVAAGTGTTQSQKVLTGADAVCAATAAARGMPGTYKAWLGTSLGASSRFGTARGWLRLDGLPFADTLDDPIYGAIFYPLEFDEAGHFVQTDTWSGVMNGNCNEWSSTSPQDVVSVGWSTAGTNRWTNNATFNCGESASLDCFGVDYTAPLQPTPPAGPSRIAFVTHGQFLVPHGPDVLGEADALCGAEAAKQPALASHRFKAMLATTSVATSSRFQWHAIPVVRTDGASVVDSDLDLRAMLDVKASIGVEADGKTYSIGALVWIGTSSFDKPSAADGSEDCLDWTTYAYANTGIQGVTSFTTQGGPYRFGTLDSCANGGVLYCLEDL